jgi:hypothetical protein
MALQT